MKTSMEFEETALPGVKLIQLPRFEDNRGDFVKIFHGADFAANDCALECRETYLTTSSRWILRGMHFQVPPNDYAKLVCVIGGRVLDVVLDLRRSSPSYGKYFSVELDARSPTCVFIPPGLAHGFLALEDDSRVLYLQSAVHAPESDRGILWSSFGFQWPGDGGRYVLSQRDMNHPRLSEFSSPFE
jgi:dTDP-4-dehydrorhamnose 3,5-epimerase